MSEVDYKYVSKFMTQMNQVRSGYITASITQPEFEKLSEIANRYERYHGTRSCGTCMMNLFKILIKYYDKTINPA